MHSLRKTSSVAVQHVSVNQRQVCPMSIIPGPPKDAKLGSLPDMMERNGGSADNLFAQFPRILAEYREEFGPVVDLSIPPLGDQVVSSNPEDFINLYRTEGLHPPGLVEQLWQFKRYCEIRGHDRVVDLLGRGEAWQQVRRKLAADLMRPQAARNYLPHINSAVDYAVDSVGHHSLKMDDFISRLAFDMFTAVCTGNLMQTVDPANAHAADLKFISDTQNAFKAGLQMFEQQVMPEEHPSHPLWFKFVSAMDDAGVRGREIVGGMLEELEAGRADEMQVNSYLGNLFFRGELDKEEIESLLMLLLQAGVDTTAAVTNWLLINLAKNPEVQSKLRAEVLMVAGPTGDITAEHLSKMKYLKDCIRESHRLSPPFGAGTMRAAPEDLEFSGFHVSKGTMVMTDTCSLQQSADFVDGADSFRPERWDAKEVSQRRGTDKEVIDHPLLRDPFGMGARSCLGQRVAKLEIQVAVAKLVRCWEFELEPDQSWKTVMAPLAKAEPFPQFACRRVE